MKRNAHVLLNGIQAHRLRTEENRIICKIVAISFILFIAFISFGGILLYTKGITMTSLPNKNDLCPSFEPTPKLTLVARDCAEKLSSLKGKTYELRTGSSKDDAIRLPRTAIEMLKTILEQLGRGNSVTLMLSSAQLTTQQAADLLGVSRPFLVKLLEEGQIPFHKVGSHRRIIFEDVFSYKADINTKRKKILTELARESQEFGF
jgi:excisionase family DNA binding protein